MIDPLERMRAGNPVVDPEPPRLDSLLARLQEREAHAAAPTALSRTRVLRWRYRVAVIGALLAAFAVALVLSGGSRQEPSILASAYAATDSKGVVLYYHEQESVSLLGHTGHTSTTDREGWLSSSAVRERSSQAGEVSETVINANGLTIYSPKDNQIIYLRSKLRLPLRIGTLESQPQSYVPNALQDPVSQLRSWYAEGSLELHRQETDDGHTYDVLVPSGRASSALPGTRVLIDAQTFVPVEISNEIAVHGKLVGRRTVSFLSFQRLPLTPTTKAKLRLAPHPGAKIVTSPGRDTGRHQ